MTSCGFPSDHDKDFQEMCRSTAQVFVLDEARWQEYVKLAINSSPRIDRKPTVIQTDGFTVLHGKMREKLAPSFPVGIHDDETAIIYAGKEIAILRFKVLVTKTFSGVNASGCLVRYGLEPFILSKDA